MNSLETAFRLTTGDYEVQGNFGKGYDAFFAKYLKSAKVPQDAQGFCIHRYKDNPVEKLWALRLANQCRGFVHYLLGRDQQRVNFVDAETTKIVATAFQHLGSPVGQGSIRDLLCALPSRDKEVLIKDLQNSLDCHQ